MLSGISIVCFAASYAVTMALEITRFFFRATVRTAVMRGFGVAGLFAHTVFLGSKVQQRWQSNDSLATWYLGCLMLSWLLAAFYLWMETVHRRSTIGLFLLPTCLILIATAHLFPSQLELVGDSSRKSWGLVHGASLLLGTAMVVVGFIAGIMYLIQSHRLKQKLPPRSVFWFPSLEKLQTLNERALYGSIGLLGIGLVTGCLLNVPGIVDSDVVIPWTDPVVLASLVWLLWLLTVLLFNGFYRPSRQGRKVAYLTVCSFIFLSLVMGIMFLVPSQHTNSAAGGLDETRQARRMT